MTLEIQVERLAVSLVAHQQLQHADDLGAFFIDGGGVEVIDFNVFRRPHRMRQRPCILAELARAQLQHFLDAFHRMGPLVARELLIAEHGQPFLQAQLEPVAAGDAVAGPVVEILVRYDALDQFVIAVGRGFGAGEHVFGVEHVQPLVLHRAHVEIVDRDDHEQVEVVFAAIDLFVPAHRAFQRVHGIGAFALVARTDIDLQLDLAAGHRGERVVVGHQIARHQREQVGRFRPRVMPLAMLQPVAVRQQDRDVAGDRHAENTHHVGAVGVIGDLAESLRLALGAIHAVRHVQPLQRRIGLRVDLDLGFPDETALRHQIVRHAQALVVQQQGVFRHLFAVDLRADKFQVAPVQPQVVRAFGGPRAVGRKGDPRPDPRRRRVQREIQVHCFHPEGGCGVICEFDARRGCLGSHSRLLVCAAMWSKIATGCKRI